MRVIGGVLGGRRLVAPRGVRTRPTGERVREAVFSILGPLEGERVLDLYAGSGALGIEALSRGAGAATFVERARAPAAAIERNLAALDLDGVLERRDVLAYLTGGAAGELPGPFDLVFCDPPYSSAIDHAGRLSVLLPAVLSEDARIVTESADRAPLRLDLPLLTERRYGDTRVAVHRST